MRKKGLIVKALRQFITAIFASAFLLSSAQAQDAHGSKEQAVAMVNKAIEHIKADGRDKAFADFTAGVAPYKDRDLYVFVWDLSGKALAHGGNPKLVGKDLSELKDADGLELGKAFIAAGKSAPKGSWINYRWPNGVTKELESKSTWLVVSDGLMVGVGTYR
jgi:cytochrome c